jgi:hypothetical protein
VRGGAIPLLAWVCLLAVLMAGNWVWTGDAIQIGAFGFAVLVIVGAAALLVATHRGAIRRGPPEPPSPARVETAPDLSFAAVLAAVAVASILFGLTWAYFLVYFGGGLLILSLGRLALELQAARASRERHANRSLPDPAERERGS